jgi:predicted alpha-1,2-mannosidase
MLKSFFKIILLLFVFLTISIESSAKPNKGWPVKEKLTPADWVFPQSGTEVCRWFFFNSTCRPFGMINLSPDTRTGGDWENGYLYNDTKIRCFSHIHGWQLYGLAVMPFTGEPKGNLGMNAYQSDFSHADEEVHPGYHKVVLKTYGITAELTSTMRVGMHRYTFPVDAVAGIYFDLGAVLMDSISFSEVKKVSPTQLEGYAIMAPTSRRPKPFRVFFIAALNKPVTEFGGWVRGKNIANVGNEVSGKNAGAWVRFGKDKTPLLMKVAISYTSIEGAKKNMEGELAHWDFDRVVNESRNEWNQWLGKIEVKTKDAKLKTRFYTDLWHSLLGRRVVSDLDGSYCDNTGPETLIRKVRSGSDGKPLFAHHNFDALWGAHWSINLLWSIAYPKVMDEFCNTMVDMFHNGGLIPRGPSGGNYTFVMIGDPAASFFAAAYHKGIRNWDVNAAWEGLRKNAFPGGIRDHAGYEHSRDKAAGGGIKYYVERGYVPEDIEGKGMHKDGASETMEYAYQDWCLAELATSLKKDDAKLFYQRSQNYKNLWDSTLNWMHPRNKDGSWLANFNPVTDNGKAFTTKGFCEATGAIYTHYVPQDPAGLIKLFGGPAKYVEALNKQFEMGQQHRFVAPVGNHGMAWIDYGNQPSTGMAELFNFAGAPWLSQKWIRLVRDSVFSDITPANGYHGDEDQGMMGSVSALMALGLFDEQGGASQRPTYQLSAPVFDEIIIKLDPVYYKGLTFKILAHNTGPKNVYIQSAKLNGKPLNTFWFYHEDLAKGGVLELELGPTPNKKWGKLK